MKSKKKYWWKCHNKKCGCNWQATIYSRLKLGNVCPKCEEKKKNKLPENLVRLKGILKEIKKIQKQSDEHILNFINDNSSNASKQKSSVIVRRSIDKIKRLIIEFREIVLKHKKYKINFNKENKLLIKQTKNER